jgi:hypothetical protein
MIQYVIVCGNERIGRVLQKEPYFLFDKDSVTYSFDAQYWFKDDYDPEIMSKSCYDPNPIYSICLDE